MDRKRCSFVVMVASVVCAIAFFSRDAGADGKHFPEKAYKQAPAIPGQRAILTYKDGAEKLTIESALDGPGREFGWVIPLPSKPTEFAKVSPGLIKTFSLVLQPEIVHDLTSELSALCVGVAFVTLCCLIVVSTKSAARVLLLIFLFVFFVGTLMPPLGIRFTAAGTAPANIPGVKVHEVRQVGSYELAVLEAESSQALDAWLEGNGFAGLTALDEEIVSDYIKDEWCFVAAKLHRQGDGYSRPHPLSMTFASEKPVYPMRLTSTVGSDVYLELYVIADRQAACDVLTLEVSDAYRFRAERKSSHSDLVSPSTFGGETYRQNIGHSDAAEFMWDGCVVSKLCGTLKPEQMGEDIVLQLKTGEPCRKRYYSRRGARDRGLVSLLRIWCGLPVVLALVYHDKRKQPSGKRVFVVRFLVPSVVLSFLVWALIYAVLPKIDVRTSSGGRGMWIKQHMMASKLLIFAKDHDDFSGNSEDEIAELVAGFFESTDTTNIYTGEPIRHEDSPGDYTLIEDDRGVVWRTYSQDGSADDHVVKPSG